jgi:purine-binding chemotaxis protein CheW
MTSSGQFSVGPEDRGESADKGVATNALRDALRSLGASGGRGGAVSNLSAQQLAELAQRAGLSGDMADLARITGLELGSGRGTQSVSTGPQYVVFAIRDLEASVPPEAVQMVERLPDITPVPNTVDWVMGVVQVRGSIVSVVDLAGFLGLGATMPTTRTRLLVISQRGMSVGFVVDAVLEMRADSNDMRVMDGSRAPDALAPYCSQVFALNTRQIAVLDVQRLLFAEKMHQYRAGPV